MSAKGNIYVTWLIAIGLLFTVFGAMAADYSGGSGTEEDPYQIGNVEDWTTLAATAADFDKHFILIADLDFGGGPVTPMGAASPRFNGVFDGGGYVLRNGYIDFPSTSYIGIFPCVTANATIRNFGVEAVEITGKDYVGGLVGYNMGAPVTNCYVTGTVSGEDYVGCLLGCNDFGTVSSCYATGTLSGHSKVGGLMGQNYGGAVIESYSTSNVTSTGYEIGGLAGYSMGTVTSCYAMGAVSGVSTGFYIGGLVGHISSSSTVTSCYSTGEVTGTSDDVGGLAGYNEGTMISCYSVGVVMGDNNVGGLVGNIYSGGTVTSCYATGEVSGAEHVGGLVGDNGGTVTSCYATGVVKSTPYVSYNSYAGGLVGYNNGTVTSCYATGGVSGKRFVGGLVGYIYSGGKVTSCYSKGAVTSSDSRDVGGLVGYLYSGGTVTSCYWDIDASGRSTSAGGEGRRTIEMTYPSAANTYVDWDFTSVWVADVSSTVNNGYPYLLGCTYCMDNGDCDDSIACTVDSCAPLEGCINMPDDTLCDDGVACTVDSCDPATGCVYTPDDTLCSDGDACNGLETCDATNGCQPGTPLECDDGIACTIDNCDPATGCVFTPDNTLCDDGDACTIDHCDPDMGCMYEDFPVNDGNACTIDICDPVTGVAYEAVDCNDDDACTIDSCDPATGCHYEDISCDDADACTIDSCDPATGCVNTPVNCDDGDPTTEDACDPATGTCLHTPLPVPHPADINEDYRLVLSETIAYLAGWQQGANPIGHAIRAAYLWQNGEYYSYDPTETPPLCWILPEPAEGEGEPIEGEDKTVFLPGDIPLEMLWIPGGSFLMGRYSEELDSEVSEDPQHTVTFQHGFWMGKYEVTQKQWLAVVGSWPNVDQPSEAYGVGDDYPAYYVSWYNVKDFITALNTHLENTDQDLFTLRLPSEAEWEYACRAGTNTRFHWGDDLLYEQLGDHAWYRFNSSDKTNPIGLKLENAFGLHDMSGNVWEWCEDDLHDNYVGAPTDGSAWVDSPRASKRVVRGGSWANLIWRCRSANRGLGSSESGYNFGGFRLVAD